MRTKKQRTFVGTVTKCRVAIGSKSERDAVLLETDIGSLILRRHGSNAFSDAELDKWIGKKIIVKGLVHENVFIVQEIKPADI